MLADRAARVNSYTNEGNRLLAIKTEYEKRKTELGLELPAVKELTKSNHQKYWFMNKSCATLGWNPVTNNYEKVKQEKIPSEAEIMRQVSFEPDSQLSNLPLSIYQLLKFGERFGATESCLISIIVIYLKKHKEAVLDTLNTK